MIWDKEIWPVVVNSNVHVRVKDSERSRKSAQQGRPEELSLKQSSDPVTPGEDFVYLSLEASGKQILFQQPRAQEEYNQH